MSKSTGYNTYVRRSIHSRVQTKLDKQTCGHLKRGERLHNHQSADTEFIGTKYKQMNTVV